MREAVSFFKIDKCQQASAGVGSGHSKPRKSVYAGQSKAQTSVPMKASNKGMVIDLEKNETDGDYQKF